MQICIDILSILSALTVYLSLEVSCQLGPTLPPISRYIFWNPIPSQHTNETFYIPLGEIGINETKCSIETKHNVFSNVMQFNTSRSPNYFSQVVKANLTSNLSLPIFNDSKSNKTITDYRIVRHAMNSFYEIQVVYDQKNDNSTILYSEGFLDQIRISDKNLTVLSTHSGTIKAYVDRGKNILFEVCKEEIGSTMYINFRVGFFNKTAGANFRKSSLFQTSNFMRPKAKASMFKDMGLVPIGTNGPAGENYQFIFFRKGFDVVYLCTSKNSVQKSSSITIEQVTLPFLVENIQYIEQQFIILTTRTVLKDNANRDVPSFMNYYVLNILGRVLQASTLKDCKELYRGELLQSYLSLDRQLILFDFKTPDLDGIPDQTPISSLYFSQSSSTFELFLEEFAATRYNQPYRNGSYFRLTIHHYLVEVFKTANQTHEYSRIALTHRKTGRDCSDVLLPVPHPIATIHYFKGENILMIKYLLDENNMTSVNSTQMLILYEPYIVYQPLPLDPKNIEGRRLQIQDKKTNTVQLDVKCSRPSSTFTPEDIDLKTITFFLAREDNEYYLMMKRNPADSDPIPTEIKKTLAGETDISTIYPSGLEVSRDISKIVKGSFFEVFLNKNGERIPDGNHVSRDAYSISIPSIHISMPVLFEVRKGRRIERTLIMDVASRTSYYRLRGSNFVHVQDAADSRSISSINMLTTNDAIMNVSKNIFALDVLNLKERPLTSLGSYCMNVENVRVSNMNDMLLCLTEDTILVHYTQERYSAFQTKIPLQLFDFASFAKKNSVIKMFYTKKFANNLFILSHTNPLKSNKTYHINVLDLSAADTILQINFIQSIPLPEVTEALLRPNVELYYTDMIERDIILLLNDNSVYIYTILEDQRVHTPLKALFTRRIDMNRHFRPYNLTIDGQRREVSFDVKIKSVHPIIYTDNLNENYRAEKSQIKRLTFLLEVRNKQLQKVFYSVILFEHRATSYDAFKVIFGGDNCAKLFIGPSFLNEGEKQDRSLVFVCVPGKIGEQVDPDIPREVKVLTLQSYDNKFTFSEDSKIEEIFKVETKEEEEKSQRDRVYEVSFFKSPYLFDILEQQQNKNRLKEEEYNNVVLTRRYLMKFAETYRKFDSKMLTDKQKEESVSEQVITTALGLLRKKKTSVIRRNVQNYFIGHIFNTVVECESYIECRDNIINGTSQVSYMGKLEEFKEFRVLSRFKEGFIELKYPNGTRYNMSYLAGVEKIITSVAGKEVHHDFGTLNVNCSEFKTFETYLIAICLYQSKSNFFRIVDMASSLQWYDIPVNLPSKRLINAKDMQVTIQDDYIVLHVYNIFFKRYLVMFSFKLIYIKDEMLYNNVTQNSDYITKIHSGSMVTNRLNKYLSILYISENSMNDEYSTFKVYNLTSGPYSPLNSSQILIIFSLRRKSHNTYFLRVDGMKVEGLQVSKYIIDKRIDLVFDVAEDQGGEYLLDDAAIIPLTDDDQQFYDIAIHFPNAQDYLVRIERDAVANKSLNTTIGLDKLRVLTISNPFFGIQPYSLLKPIFFNQTYHIMSNYQGGKSILRSYSLDSESRSLAQKFNQSMKLFSFKDKHEDKRNNIEEVDFNSIYTYSTHSFQGYARSFNTKDRLYSLGHYENKKELRMEYSDLFILWVNGTYSHLMVGPFVNLLINYDFLSSSKLTFISKGTKSERRVQLILHSKSTSFSDLLTCMVQLLGVAVLGGLAVWIVDFCYKKKDNLRLEKQEEEKLVLEEIEEEGLVAKDMDDEEIEEEESSSEEDDEVQRKESDSFELGRMGTIGVEPITDH